MANEREFRLYCVHHHEFVGKDLRDSETFDVDQSETSDDRICLFRYKEVQE